MSIETVVGTVKDGIQFLRFNKPNKKNAIDHDMCVHITKVLNDAAINDNISMVVFTGTGDFYSSGFDVSYRTLHPGELYTILEAFVKAFITFPKIIIAIVNGPAIGIAATTLALCDFVFASDNSYFYTPFTKLGVVAEACSSVTFPKLMGERKAMDMLLLNYKMTATEALEYGLISNLYKQKELLKKSWEKIKEISDLPPHSVLFTKKLLKRTSIEELLRTNEIEMKALHKLHDLRKSKL